MAGNEIGYYTLPVILSMEGVEKQVSSKLSRAFGDVGKKAGKVGFDWPGWEGSFAKIDEEVGELRAAATSGTAAEIHHELGDLLLAVVNVSRKLKVAAAPAPVDATLRFERRFEFIEDRLRERGKTPQTSNLDEMDALWNDAKRAGVS